MIKWWQYILFPFGVLYDATTRFRNHLFNIGYKPSFEFETNVICVGNLAAGGTGKTPAVIYLVEYLLSKGKTVATLSRGYGRKTRGFRVADGEDDASTLGDEPLLFYQYFKDRAMVTVGEERAFAIPQILFEEPDLDVIVMDDGFQHRQVKPSLSIVLTTYDRLFYDDFVLPVGLLRESRNNLQRADVVIVTKCPHDLSDEERTNIAAQIKRYNAEIPVFFGGIEYSELSSVNEKSKLSSKVIVVTSIANPDLFVNKVADEYDILHHFKYRDHHNFKESDIRSWHELSLNENAAIITTEKDLVKIKGKGSFANLNLFVWPIKQRFLENEEEFLKIIDDSIKDYSQTE